MLKLFVFLFLLCCAKSPEVTQCPIEETQVTLIKFNSINTEDEKTSIPIVLTDGVRVVETETGQLDKPVAFPPGSYDVTVVTRGDPLVLDDYKRKLLKPIYFDTDSDEIRFPESVDTLLELVVLLSVYDEIELLEIGGFTDDIGTDQYNLDLSGRRVRQVIKFLIDHGVSESRLIGGAYGEKPQIPNCGKIVNGTLTTSQCHQMNRRVEFFVLKRSDM